MPTVLKDAGCRYFFYSYDGHEPAHIHVVGEHGTAKIWLKELAIAKRTGFSDVELRRILKVVADNRQLFTEAWNDFFA